MFLGPLGPYPEPAVRAPCGRQVDEGGMGVNTVPVQDSAGDAAVRVVT